MSLTLQQYGEHLRKTATNLPSLLKKPLITGALRMEAEAKQNATTVLHVRTGRLRASIKAAVESTRITLQAGSSGANEVRYARIHETGGVIRPKKGKYLVIPLGPAKTAAGVGRYASPRDASAPLAFVQSRGGQPMLVSTQRTKGGKAGKAYGEPWYLLRYQVRIPARPYLGPAFTKIEPLVVQDVIAAITKAVMDG